jgi:hypothetical protein
LLLNFAHRYSAIALSFPEFVDWTYIDISCKFVFIQVTVKLIYWLLDTKKDKACFPN